MSPLYQERWFRWMSASGMPAADIAFVLECEPAHVESFLARRHDPAWLSKNGWMRRRFGVRLPVRARPGGVFKRSIARGNAGKIQRMHALGYSAERIAQTLCLYLPSVRAYLRRMAPVRRGSLKRPRTKREQKALDHHRRRRDRAAAERAARALWARCAAPLDDVGCTAAIVPTTDELLDLVYEPERPPCPIPSHWDQRGHQRTRWGEDNGQARLTRQLAAEIRQDHAAGVSVAELARRHGVARGTITAIVKGRTWLEPPDDNERDDDRPPPAAGIDDDGPAAKKAKRQRWRPPAGTPKLGARGSGALHDDDDSEPLPALVDTPGAIDPAEAIPAPRLYWATLPDDHASDIADDL
jgi:hypothetical protein